MAFEIPADLAATVYADVDAIDAVADLRVGGAAWLALDATQKEQVASAVTQTFDSLDFLGEMTDPDQNLEWPRTGTDYSSDAWPSRLVNAAIEYAILLAPSVAAGTDPLNPVDTSSGVIKREKVGPLETEYFESSATASSDAFTLDAFPPIVQRLLAPLLQAATSSAWGSATVTRGS